MELYLNLREHALRQLQSSLWVGRKLSHDGAGGESVQGAVLFASHVVVWTAFIGSPSQRQAFCRDRLMRRSISRERKSPARFR